MVKGMKINKCNHTNDCDICYEAKGTKLPFPKKSKTEFKQKLDLIHTDICGPIETETPGGKRYILTCIDYYSKYTRIFLLRHKSEAQDRI